MLRIVKSCFNKSSNRFPYPYSTSRDNSCQSAELSTTCEMKNYINISFYWIVKSKKFQNYSFWMKWSSFLCKEPGRRSFQSFEYCSRLTCIMCSVILPWNKFNIIWSINEIFRHSVCLVMVHVAKVWFNQWTVAIIKYKLYSMILFSEP